MHFAFDLISDLHVETWDKFNWEGQPTAPYCIVAGDVSRDPELVMETLEHLGKQYAGVFYIDGNDEHRYYLENLEESYQILTQITNRLKNVVYMQDNCVIINGVAIIATNGWWTYDLNLELAVNPSMFWYQDKTQISTSAANAITGVAYHDAAYVINSISKLQRQQDVNSIIVVTHTVPGHWLIEHDVDFTDNYRTNVMGNRHIQMALDEDTENKIKAWCFGHYHKQIDRNLNGVRFVCNPRGRGDMLWNQTPYYPKRIQIDV